MDLLNYLEQVADAVSERGYDYYEALNVAECVCSPDHGMNQDVVLVISVLEGAI